MGDASGRGVCHAPGTLKPVKASRVRLNLGSGEKGLLGYVSVDRKLGSEVYPLDYPDESVDEVYASHVLEHFQQSEILSVLKEWLRVLKPGCKMFISVPDFDRIRGKDDAKWPSFLMGGQVDENDFHKSVFDHYILATKMAEAGLEELSEWRSSMKDTSANPISLNMMGRKPMTKSTSK